MRSLPNIIMVFRRDDMSTLSKKEVEQPDRFMLMMTTCMDYIRTHEKKILIALAVALALIAVAVAWYLYDKKQETDAMKQYNAAFMKATNLGEANASKPEDIVKAFELIAENHRGTRAAWLALYQLATVNLRMGNTDKAIDLYNRFIDASSRQSELVGYAYGSLGYCYASKKNYEKALEMFRKAVQDNAKSAFSANIYYEMGGVCELQGKKSDAVKHYQKALEQNPPPTLTALIKRKIVELS